MSDEPSTTGGLDTDDRRTHLERINGDTDVGVKKPGTDVAVIDDAEPVDQVDDEPRHYMLLEKAQWDGVIRKAGEVILARPSEAGAHMQPCDPPPAVTPQPTGIPGGPVPTTRVVHAEGAAREREAWEIERNNPGPTIEVEGAGNVPPPITGDRADQHIHEGKQSDIEHGQAGAHETGPDGEILPEHTMQRPAGDLAVDPEHPVEPVEHHADTPSPQPIVMANDVEPAASAEHHDVPSQHADASGEEAEHHDAPEA